MMREMRGAATGILLAAVLLAGLLLRVSYAPALGLHDAGPNHTFVVDEQEYYSAASMLAEGRGFSFYDTFTWTRAPLYVIFLAAVFRVAGKDLNLVYALQALMSVATVYMLALLAGRIAARSTLLSRRAATLIAAAIGSFWLSFTLYSGLLLSETLFLLLFVGSLLLLAVYIDRRDSGGVGVRSWLLVLGAGLLLGLAVLTRSTALGFVPLAALVLVWPQRRSPRFAAALLLLVGVALVVMPWTIRNYAAYGRLTLIDTTGGYNLWLASVGVRDEARLATELRSIDGPLAKQDFAYSQAFANIAADPLGFVAKGLHESVDLWSINPSAEERQIGGYSQGRVSAVHLLSLTLLEDLLYVVIVALALAGLLAGPRDPLKWLVLLWVLLWVVVAFVFFAVNRFRFPMIAALIPWVPLGAAQLLATLRARRATWWRVGRTVLLPALAALLLLLTLPLDVTALGVSRWNAQALFRAAERLLSSGDLAAARTLYQQADGQLVDTKYSLAVVDINLALREHQNALLDEIAARSALTADLNAPGTARFEPYILRGAIALLRGDNVGAAAYLGARPPHDQVLAALAWANAHLLLPAPTRLEIGSELDLPFLDGFYAPESYAAGDYRWTAAEATLRVGGTDQQQVAVRWSGWRPQGVAPAVVQVYWRTCAAGGAAPVEICPWNSGPRLELPSVDTWQEDVLAVPAGSQLRFDVNGFIPGGFDPRELGLRVDWVAAR